MSTTWDEKQALIYGWVLQFSYALIPYLVQRYLPGDSKPRLGGNWFILLTVNTGSALVWASIFVLPLRSSLHSAAYLFYVMSMLPVAWQVGCLLHDWYKRMETSGLTQTGD